jgi:hypothetical protein
MVKFRNENGEELTGELVNSFRIMVEPSGETVYIDQENPVEIDVMTFDGTTLAMHRIPMLAIVNMQEVVALA